MTYLLLCAVSPQYWKIWRHIENIQQIFQFITIICTLFDCICYNKYCRCHYCYYYPPFCRLLRTQLKHFLSDRSSGRQKRVTISVCLSRGICGQQVRSNIARSGIRLSSLFFSLLFQFGAAFVAELLHTRCLGCGYHNPPNQTKIRISRIYSCIFNYFELR